MILTLRLLDSIPLPPDEEKSYHVFLQRMVNRVLVGRVRYGPINRNKQYIKRLQLEIKEYEKTGNAEHLYNAANYAFLESYSPSHPKFHLNATTDSATRKRV